MYTDTITVFNQQKVKKQITWYPTVIRGVELQITAGRNRSTTGLENADSAKVFIKYENSNGKMLVETSQGEKREYLKPKSWNAHTKKNQAFTFQEGIDFFIQGEYQEVAIMDADYEDGFLSYMSDRYDDLFLVNKADLYKTIPHLEIGGR
ncbi:MAG: hypothetical protein EGP96_12060 [Roseburia inulinivorans]|nr:hypothetical protein [Roseburia inulinivorans]